ncbi:ESPR-type extended signal peptide-containing protein [Haemophilus haemolyticus]|uniref:ESPR-type extended signal peptide-containing protein n=1 Tax=Haemophilus haemolyticus TaxID=726 RepID=UPI001EFE2E8D|nr:YadA-like family protein [Haemophilus haemolyticus]
MNHIYRIIFNRASGVFQVVSELAKGKVKSAKTSVKLTALCMALVSGAVLADDPASTPAPAADNTQKELEILKTKLEALEKQLANVHYFNTNSQNGKNISTSDSGAVAPDSIAIGKDAEVKYYSFGGIALGRDSVSSGNLWSFGLDPLTEGTIETNFFDEETKKKFESKKQEGIKLSKEFEKLEKELSSATGEEKIKKEAEIKEKTEKLIQIKKEISDLKHKTGSLSINSWLPTRAPFSVGYGSNNTRQITGVAAGTTDTDAVNVAQLKRATVHYFSTSAGTFSKGGNSANDAAIGFDSIAIGVDAKIGLAQDGSKQHRQIAIGRGAYSEGGFSTAIGSNSNSKGVVSNAFGYEALSSGGQSNAFGALAKALGYNSLAIGTFSTAYNSNSISLGAQAISRGDKSIAIGSSSIIENDSPYSLVLGNGAYVGKKRSPASGSIHYVDKERDTLVADGKVGETGSRRTKGNDYSIANPEPEKRHKSSIAIGLNAKGYGFQTIAIGGTAEASGSNSLSVGIGAESRGLYSSAVGSGAIAYKDYSSAFGHFSAARAENSLALGANTRINEGVNGGVALGSDSFNYRDLATIGYDISEQATKLEINGNNKQMTLLGEAGKKYQELQAEIAPLKEAYEKERQNYADLAELRNILYDLPKKEEEVNGLKANMEKLKAATNPNQAEIDKATKSYETAKNELEKMQEKLTALQTKTTIQEKDYDKAKPLIEAKLTETEKKADKAESDLNKKQQEQNKLVSTWKGTAGSVSVGNEITGITRQITGVAAGTADTDAVNLAQLKSAGLRFAVNSDNQGFADTDKTHNFYKHVGETLSILGESGVGYKADLYSSRNLITYHDNDGIRIAMKTNPVFDRLTLVNKDDPSKSLELYAKTGDDGKAHLIQAEKAPETDNAVKEKPQTPNNGTDGNHNTAGQGGANGQNGQDGGSSSTGNAGSAGNQGANGTTGHNGSTGQDGANGQNGQAGGAGSTGNAGSAGNQGTNGTTGHNGSAGQSGANGQNGANANHGINGNNGTNGLSANETDLTRAAIKGLNQATGEINRQIRKTTRESRAGIAAAMAMGQIYPVQGKRFTVGAAAGTYRGQSAVAVGVRYTPKPNMVISLSGSADTNNGVGAATGVSFGF